MDRATNGTILKTKCKTCGIRGCDIDHQQETIDDLLEQVKEKNKWIKELLENQCECEKCGCTELLCGHNKRV